MVDTSRINIPEGIDFLTWYGPRSSDENKGKEKEKEKEKEAENTETDSKVPNRTEASD